MAIGANDPYVRVYDRRMLTCRSLKNTEEGFDRYDRPPGQGAHPSGKCQGNLIFLQGQGKVSEFCKMVREIRKSSKVREKSGNFKTMLY